MLDVVVLAAGKGTRMQSSLPKVLHPIGGKPMLSHVLDTAFTLPESKVTVVVGHGAEQVQQQYDGIGLNFVQQTQQLGTGHAVQMALPILSDHSITLILYGDVPLIQTQTLQQLISLVSDNSMGLLTLTLDNPNGYGRIIRDQHNQVVAIVEQKDASDDQKNIREVNTGILAVNTKHLQQWLPSLSNDNAQQEYYLTDVIALATQHNVEVRSCQPNTEMEVLGVNDRQQQAQLERFYQQQQAEQLMAQGVTLLDPQRFDCRGEISIGKDVIIDINCIFEGKVTIGDNVTIGANCILKDCSIASGTQIKPNSMIDDSSVGEHCDIGPFTRVRPGTQLAQGARLGNFVETKKANIGVGSKVNHLTYIGDAEIGENVNVGAGTITCNYDGVNKFKTEIGDGAFIGSNSSLVAPVNIGAGATIGAGSTITSKVEAEQLAVARGKQRNINGWQKPTKKD